MANRSLFGWLSRVAKADAVNEAGGVAYALSPKQALAQFAATGCLNSTFYVDAPTQLEKVLELAVTVEPEFVARVALYSRSKGFMKDMPALLVAVLSVRSPGLMAEVFDRVIDSPKMLRNFVQIMRSGQVGRRSLGSLPKRMVSQWIERRTPEQLFRASIGNEPSLADVIRMVHPKPGNAEQAAMFGYLIGKAHDESKLPAVVRAYEALKRNAAECALPDVPMAFLTNLSLTKPQWALLAERESWQTLRMNLNTFLRHGVFEDENAVRAAAARLKDPAEIAAAKVFPYQLLAAYSNASARLPIELRNALQDAMEVAIERVPAFGGKVCVFPDVSGSMRSSITGSRPGSTSKVSCMDVAALIAAAVVRKNPEARVLPFSEKVIPVSINPKDSVMTNAATLAALPGGGTNCSAPMAMMNEKGWRADLVIYVSDNESWMDSGCTVQGTATMKEWQIFKKRNPQAKLVCLDLQPSATTQARDSGDVLNIGGFSDSVFEVIAEFARATLSPDHWVGVIEQECL